MKLGGTYNSRSEKVRDFVIGFASWFAVAGVGALIGRQAFVAENSWGDTDMTGLLLTPLNVVVVILLAFRRRWMALGWLAAYAVNLVVGLAISQMEGGAPCGYPFFLPPQGW